MILNIKNGQIQYIYNENINLNCIGRSLITRASYVEPKNNSWYIDFSPILGFNLTKYGFNSRIKALEFEKQFIENNILGANI